MFLLLFAFPVTLVISAMFCVIAAAVLEEWENVRKIAVVLAVCVLLSAVMELMLGSRYGAAWLYDNWGLNYTRMHFINFFSIPPSVACLLIVACLRPDVPEWVLNAVSIAGCWIACVVVLFAHITAWEAIFGVDGVGRPVKQVVQPWPSRVG